MRNNQSYGSQELNARLRPSFDSKSPTVISHVTVVGALFDKHYNLHADDEETVKRSLKVLNRAGVGIAEEPDFHFYNLLAPLKNDFLKAACASDEKVQTDIVIVCGIWGGRSESQVIDRFPRHMREEAYEDFSYGSRSDEREVSISEVQCYKEGWSLAAHWSGAKMVVTRGPDGIDAVNSSHFLHEDFYRVAIATSENYEHVSGWIAGPLGIVVHKDAIAQISQQANRSDILGQRLIRLNFGAPK